MTEQDMIIQDLRREVAQLKAELEWKQKEIELAQRHARQWISVEDRLPSNKGGGEAAFIGDTASIKCEKCGGSFFVTNPLISRLYAKESWNRRVNDA